MAARARPGRPRGTASFAHADAAGYQRQRHRRDWALFGAATGSFSLRTDGPPTRNVCLAFAQGGGVVTL